MSKKEFNVNCIKCNTPYKSEDEEAYYCSPCNEERLKLAKEIDAKVKPSKNKGKSAIEEYDNLPKVNGFPNAKSLGLM